MCLLAFTEEVLAEKGQALLGMGYSQDDVNKVFETARRAIEAAGPDGNVFDAVIAAEPEVWQDSDKSPDHDETVPQPFDPAIDSTSSDVLDETTEQRDQALTGALA